MFKHTSFCTPNHGVLSVFLRWCHTDKTKSKFKARTQAIANQMMDVLTAIGYLLLLVIGYKLFFRILRIPKISHLDSHYILITGCDSGFGNATAKRLDSLGCHVIAACFTENGETELRESSSSKLHTVGLDVTSEKNVERAYQEITRKILPAGKGLWGLLNNAGIADTSIPITWRTVQDYQHSNSVNLYGLIRMTLKFLPLIKQEGGRVVNTASIAGVFAFPGINPYSVSKHGVEVFSDGLRRRMRCFNVSVSVVEPEGYKTPIINSFWDNIRQIYDSLPEEIKRDYGEHFLEKHEESTRRLVANTFLPDITPVVDAYEHALLGRFPQPRYGPGFAWSSWVYKVPSLTPEWFADRFLAKLLGTVDPPSFPTQ